MITGTVVNGAVIPDAGQRLPEGARIRLELVEDLPPDHPMAAYDRDTEVAIVLETIAGLERGEPTISLRQALEELSKKHGLGPLPAG